MLEKLISYFQKYYPDAAAAPRTFFAPSSLFFVGEYISKHNSPTITSTTGYGYYAAAAPSKNDFVTIIDFNKKKKITYPGYGRRQKR